MAEEVNFTVGPWRTETNNNDIRNIVVAVDGQRIASAYFRGDVPDWPRIAEANAALIAAAPELFEALSELVAIRTIKDGIDSTPGWPDMAALKARTDAAWDAARKALLKAQANGSPQEVRTGDTTA